MLLYSNNKCIMVFIDYNAIYSIVKSTNLNTTFIDRVNRCFTNVSVYLSIYLLDVYYIFSCFNLVLDALSYLRAIEDDTVRANNEAEPALDAIWDEDNEKKPDNVSNNIYLVYKMRSIVRINNFFLIEVIVQMDDILWQRFISIYKKDGVYNRIIQDLRPNLTKANKEILEASKFGYLFRFIDRLLYSKDNEYCKRLVVLFSFI
jgi:hypothetical protein